MHSIKLEPLESRIVYHQSFGDLLDVQSVLPDALEASPFHAEIQFRNDSQDFVYSSETLDPKLLDEFMHATEQWDEDYYHTHGFQLGESTHWFKVINHNPITVHPEGYLVSELFENDPDEHTQITARHFGDCHTDDGLHMRPDHLYRYSFDIRHPETEATWLVRENIWSIVTQIWGPRSSGPTSLNPPFAIFTRGAGDGKANWVIGSRGDSRESTVRPYEEERHVEVPYHNLGHWHRFDIEYVPNSQGHGLVRVWINGELVANWTDIKSSFLAYKDGQKIGPLNPQIGLYSYDPSDGQEAHYDHFHMACYGEFQSSISGMLRNVKQLEGNIVVATNRETGERIGATTNRHGVFTLPLDRGNYHLFAYDPVTGNSASLESISTLIAPSQVIDLAVSDAPSLSTETIMFTGDVDGDGSHDHVSRLANGRWQVTTIDSVTGLKATSTWANWHPMHEWTHFFMADFNGDGMQDIAGKTGYGDWWVGVSDGQEFQNALWGSWAPELDWDYVNVGDFNGDRRADIVGHSADYGTWWVSTSVEKKFITTHWGRWSTDIHWQFFVADFDRDGLDDILGRTSQGRWLAGRSSGHEFQTVGWQLEDRSDHFSNFLILSMNFDQTGNGNQANTRHSVDFAHFLALADKAIRAT